VVALPATLQFISAFSGAIVSGSKEVETAKRLIAFLASDEVAAAITKAGMERPRLA
jgi:molybdate transport system substrate-binding protein